VLSDEEQEASCGGSRQARAGYDVWLFGYGLARLNPIVHYEDGA